MAVLFYAGRTQWSDLAHVVNALTSNCSSSPCSFPLLLLSGDSVSEGLVCKKFDTEEKLPTLGLAPVFTEHGVVTLLPII